MGVCYQCKDYIEEDEFMYLHCVIKTKGEFLMEPEKHRGKEAFDMVSSETLCQKCYDKKRVVSEL